MTNCFMCEGYNDLADNLLDQYVSIMVVLIKCALFVSVLFTRLVVIQSTGMQ